MRNLNFSGEEILETIDMVRTEQLDIRTITVGISLLDCVSDNCDVLCRNIYEKVSRVASDLRHISAEISQEFGLPIINNRIAVTPVSLIAGRSGPRRVPADSRYPRSRGPRRERRLHRRLLRARREGHDATPTPI